MNERHLFIATGVLSGFAGLLTMAGHPWILFGLLLAGAGAATGVIAWLMSRKSEESVGRPVDNTPSV